MARPAKIGLEYFPLDCQMDDKVEMLEAVHDLIGFALYIKLLQEIYQTQDGELDMSLVFRWKTLGKKYGIPEENLRTMIGTMLEIGLFDKSTFEQRQVLTSNGIKSRLTEVANRRKKDRIRKAEGDSEFSGGKPPEKYTKGKGKDISNDISKKEKESNNSSAAVAALPSKSTSKNAEGKNDDEESGEKTYTLTHQIKLVIEEKFPDYYWDAKDGAHAKKLGVKLRAAVKKRFNRDPTDGECIDALKRLLTESTRLPPFYQFRDMANFNEKFNQIITQIKSAVSPSNGTQIKRSKLEIT
ncbi:DUF4373 domain-containing protein [Larkinella rosea]|uniref:DUF4373 domain-containing protein n=1 Tax=Larkinella rosea TaxID=2025312 RepID=A0A3P1BYX5_9BACT|nr:DUF4373 domain-containing protein [Larkinella rosea]RRB06295.1 DUF4373 domain-containing protein [Larkinella rosea]